MGLRGRYRKLVDNEIGWSSIVRENKLLVLEAGRCAYCGNAAELQWEHVVPIARGGPDTIDNLVQACAACNLAKSARDPVSWYGAEHAAIPRLVMGKLLKLVYQAHEENGTLDVSAFPADADLKLKNVVSIFAERSEGTG